jgi:hypothetical protein
LAQTRRLFSAPYGAYGPGKNVDSRFRFDDAGQCTAAVESTVHIWYVGDFLGNHFWFKIDDCFLYEIFKLPGCIDCMHMYSDFSIQVLKSFDAVKFRDKCLFLHDVMSRLSRDSFSDWAPVSTPIYF